VKGNVPVVEATRDEAVLPERVQEALGSFVSTFAQLAAALIACSLAFVRIAVLRSSTMS
jgi:hypothetical protein